MASEDWRTAGHTTDAPEQPAPHGATPQPNPGSNPEDNVGRHDEGPRDNPAFSGRFLTGWWRDFVRAAIFLTRIPLEVDPDNATRPLAAAVRGFPLVGLVVGMIGAVVLLAADALGLPEFASALLAIAATVAVTGGIHEDGLADTADGMMAGRDRDGTLAIMRDSRIGAFGALALIVVIGLKISALEALEPAAAAAALVAAEVAGRTALPTILRAMRPARADGLGFDAGQPARDELMLANVLGGVFILLMIGVVTGIVAMAVGAGVAALAARGIGARIGGHTGDVLGAVQQLTATTVLLVAAAVI